MLINSFHYNQPVGHLTSVNKGETFWFLNVIDGAFSRVADYTGKTWKVQTLFLFAK